LMLAEHLRHGEAEHAKDVAAVLPMAEPQNGSGWPTCRRTWLKA